MRHLTLTLLLTLGLATSVISKEMQFSSDTRAHSINDCSYILADGEITEETPQKFIEFIKEIDLRDYCSVVFNSEGGSVTAAVVLGTIIRENGLSTGVGEKLEAGEDGYLKPSFKGSCAYAFMGGVERFAIEGMIGVHQFYGSTTGNDLENSQALAGMLIYYFDSLGIDLRAIKPALITPSDEMYYYSEKELSDFMIVTNQVSGLESWQLETNGGGLIASAKYTVDMSKNYKVALCCKKPSSNLRLIFSKIATKYPWRNDFDHENDAINFAKNGIFHLDGDKIFLQERHFNFLHLDKNNLFLSFYVPGGFADETDELGGLPFFFQSTTDRGSNGRELIFNVRGNFPNKEILQVLTKNCID